MILMILAALPMGGVDSTECPSKRAAVRACNQLPGAARHECIAAYKSTCDVRR